MPREALWVAVSAQRHDYRWFAAVALPSFADESDVQP